MGVISLDLQQTDAGANKWSYNWLTDLPSINGVTIQGDLTLEDLDIIIPTKVSELENDAGYVTEEDLTDRFYTKDEVYNKDEIDDKFDDIVIPTKVSELENDAGYITEEDLTGRFYTKDEVYNKEETYNKSEVDSILEDYYTSDEVDTKISEEATARADADSALSNRINTNATNINSLAGDVAANSRAISDEATARQNADSALSGRIDTNTTNIATNTANIATNTSAIAQNTSDIATNAANIATNTAYIATNASDIAGETDAREIADQGLQEQIDALAASSDVVDIVGTYAALQAYDTSKLHDNDIIKVLDDETRNDATTYYRWAVSTSTWSYIGAEGPFYTKADADATFVPQTRTINSKALSSNVTLTAQDVGALPDSTVIPTVNNATLTIQKNGSTVQTFTANSSTNKTANITVPTKTSDLTNDGDGSSNFATETYVDTYGGKIDVIKVNGTAQTITNKTVDISVPTKTSEITNDSDFVTSTGTVAKANKLSSAKTIGIGTGGTGTATAFDGSSNITIPLTDVKDSYVTWGGKAIYNNISPDDAGCVDEFGHNKLAFLPANCIQVHYSTDGGSTWTDYGLTDAQKIQLVTYGDVNCKSGKDTAATSSNVTNLKLRVRIATAASTATGNSSLYTMWKKILINVNDPGSDAQMTFRYRTIANYKAGTETWVDSGTTYNVRGGSGWNSIPIPTSWPDRFGGHYTNQTGQPGQIEFVFSNTKLGTWGDKKVSAVSFRMIGATNWQMPSEMARTGRLYTIDAASKNATFPGSIYADSNISAYNIYFRGGGNYGHIGSSNTPFKDICLSDGIYKGSYKLTLPNKTGTVALTSDIPGVFTGAGASTAGTSGLVPAPAAGDNTKFLSGDGTWKTVSQYELPIASANTLGGVKIGENLSITSTGILSADAQQIDVDSALSTTSENPVQNKVITTELNKKANSSSLATVATSGSYNDLSNKPTIDSALSTSSTNAVQNKVVTTALNSKADTSSLATVATSGSYNDLSNKPTIPTVNNATLTIQKNGSTVKTFTANASSNVTANITVPTATSELTNDAGFIDEIPVASAGTLGGIKVGNNLSIDASGVLSADAESITVDSALSTSSPNPVQNSVITTALNGKNKTIWTANNLSPAANTPASWKTLLGGDGIYYTWYDTANKFTNQPGTYGFLMTVISFSDIRQEWWMQTSGKHYYRTGNAKGWYGQSGNAGVFKFLGDNLDSALSTTSSNPVQNKVVTNALNDKANSADLAAVATSGSYNDLSNKPTIPTVNNATLTIQKNGTNVQTFTANQSTNATANITVPTKTSELSNDSNFVASGDLATVATSGSYNDLSNKPTIPTVNNATLTIQKNGTNVQTFTANSSTNKTANIQVPNLQTSDTDPGEGSALAADTFLGIYDIAPEDVDGARLVDGSVTSSKIDWSTITAGVISIGTMAAGRQERTVSIPTQANTDYVVLLTLAGAMTGGWTKISLSVASKTTSSFIIVHYNEAGYAVNNVAINYLVIPR